MSPVGTVLYNVLFIYMVVLIARVVMETVFSFARSYEPRGVALLLLELIFTVTDPPLKLLRRLIPPLRLGQISLDLAFLVLFVLLIVLMSIAGSL